MPLSLPPRMDCQPPLPCLQIFGVRPEQLPSRLRCDLLAALRLPSTHVQASIRAGCVHLTLGALASPEERQRLAAPGAAAAVAARLAPLLEMLPGRGRLAVQLDSTGGGASAALLARQGGGRPALLLGLQAAAHALPPAVELAPGAPAATTLSAASGRFRLRCPRALLSGSAGLGLHCRAGGRHLTVGLSLAGASPPVPPGSDADSDANSDANSDASHSGDEEEEEEEVEAWDSGSEEAAEAAEEAVAAVEVVAWVPAAAPAEGGGSDGWQGGWGLYELEVARGEADGRGRRFPPAAAPSGHRSRIPLPCAVSEPRGAAPIRRCRLCFERLPALPALASLIRLLPFFPALA